jgi:acetyl esterase/lipase
LQLLRPVRRAVAGSLDENTMNSRCLFSIVGCASLAIGVVGLADESKLPGTKQPIAVGALVEGLTNSSPPVLSNATILPRTYVYREIAGRALKAYVFVPTGKSDAKQTPAILLFHGGGWSAGSAEWTFDSARRFAAWGLVAISIEYRLSQGSVTPIDALDDTCAAFRWARQHADELSLDPKRVAGYGVSAGGHLLAAAATVGCPTNSGSSAPSEPDALLLWSPALDVTADGWFRKLLQGRARPTDYSPADHAGPTTPPTSIVHGAKDTLTPLSGVKRFCDRMTQAGGICELNVYEGVGHLLTRNLANQESDFDPDPKARADGITKQERFLSERGYIPRR